MISPAIGIPSPSPQFGRKATPEEANHIINTLNNTLENIPLTHDNVFIQEYDRKTVAPNTSKVRIISKLLFEAFFPQTSRLVSKRKSNNGKKLNTDRNQQDELVKENKVFANYFLGETIFTIFNSPSFKRLCYPDYFNLPEEFSNGKFFMTKKDNVTKGQALIQDEHGIIITSYNLPSSHVIDITIEEELELIKLLDVIQERLENDIDKSRRAIFKSALKGQNPNTDNVFSLLEIDKQIIRNLILMTKFKKYTSFQNKVETMLESN